MTLKCDSYILQEQDILCTYTMAMSDALYPENAPKNKNVMLKAHTT